MSKDFQKFYDKVSDEVEKCIGRAVVLDDKTISSIKSEITDIVTHDDMGMDFKVKTDVTLKPDLHRIDMEVKFDMGDVKK